jgi:hypothetical protein
MLEHRVPEAEQSNRKQAKGETKMYRTIEISDNEAGILRGIETTKLRACAIIENGLRDGENVTTEYDRMAYRSMVSQGQAPAKPHITIETVQCSWTRANGFCGIGWLPSHLLPYNLEVVYRTIRETAMSQARQDAKADFLAVVNNAQPLYRRTGSHFERI